LAYAAQHGLRCVDTNLEPEFTQAQGVELFHDPVHPTAEGQRRLAAVIARHLGPVRPLAQEPAAGSSRR
jgi:phospholipase/lecithinase/hemolysin